MSEVHLVVPAGIDDPGRPSGGNTYDRQVRDGLSAAGWHVQQHSVSGGWPRPSADDLARLGGLLGRLPDRARVVVDGLVGCAAPDMVAPAAARLAVTVLVHMPLGAAGDEAGPGAAEGEGRTLRAAAAVITTSEWTRDWLRAAYALPASHIHVARPGVAPAEPTVGSPDGTRLLCVAAVRRAKGHDILVEALARLTDLSWRCVCVGSTQAEPDVAAAVVRQATQAGLSPRMELTGTLTGPALADAYATADLLVLPSRAETFGMVVTEALAHAVPVVAADQGGVSEALGHAPDGTRPGLLVPPDDPAALAHALRAWLSDAALRQRLRLAAASRRGTLEDWAETRRQVESVVMATTLRAG